MKVVLILLAFVLVPGLAHAEMTLATWYRTGTVMKSGERFNPHNPHAVAAALYPIGSVLRIFHNGKSLEVVVKDAMPLRTRKHARTRTIDFTPAGADALGFRAMGVVPVWVDALYVPTTRK